MDVPFKVLLIMAIAAMALASRPSSYARHCGRDCDLDLCKRIRCRGIEEAECKGKIRQGGGFCRCCQNCIIPIPKGLPCNPDPGYGIPEPVAYCDEGLTCDCRTKRCVPCGQCEYPLQ
uniref:U22-Hexatoxin-Hc1a_1 n=1 Tax=Hadronyche cerberea TaxID=1107879 RepID=A0A4Q8K7D6_HADCE